MEPLEKWFTVAELVEHTGFKKSAINRAIREGRLEAVSPNGGTRYRMVSESGWNRFIAMLREEAHEQEQAKRHSL